MKKERNELELLLYSLFDSYATKDEVINKVIDKFSERNILRGDIIKIINKNDSLESKSEVILYLLAKYFYEVTGEPPINPANWFTDLEIKEADKYKETKAAQKKFPIIIENVIKMADGYYTTVETIQTIVDWYARRIISYNFETQRNPKVKVLKDKIVESVNVNTDSVSEIEKEIINGTFIPNYVTLNVLQNGEESIKYDPTNRVLVIESGEVNILDGFHRSLAFMGAVKQFPNIERFTGVNITNFDVDKARKFIRQEDKRNKIDETFLESLNSENFESIVIKKINERSDSELKGKVAIDKTFIEKGDALVLYDDLGDSIKSSFHIKNMREANLIADWLIEGLNEIIGLKYDEIISKNTILSNSKIFMGYIALLADLQNKSDWKKQIEKVLNNVEEQRIINTGINKNVAKTKIIKELKEYFMSLT